VGLHVPWISRQGSSPGCPAGSFVAVHTRAYSRKKVYKEIDLFLKYLIGHIKRKTKALSFHQTALTETNL
jgi:hypothetical protein